MAFNNPCTNGMINCNDTIGQVLYGLTQQMTGSWFITLLFVLLFLIGIALMFNIRLEYTAIIILPLLLGLMIVSPSFIGYGFLIILYLVIIATSNFIIK